MKKYTSKPLVENYVSVNKDTANYLSQFWKLPSQETVEQIRENLMTVDKNWSMAK